MARYSSEDRRQARMRKAGLEQSNPSVARVVERNIRRIAQLRKIAEDSRSAQDKFADSITNFTGSMGFVYVHAAFFVFWIVFNVHEGKRAIDPYPFNFLTMSVSLEAIFLSTFLLVSQNRMQSTNDDRDDLDLQVDLLAEYEITRSLRLIRAMAEKMGIQEADDPELEELGQAIKPQTILNEIGSQSASGSGAKPRPTPGSNTDGASGP